MKRFVVFLGILMAVVTIQAQQINRALYLGLKFGITSNYVNEDVSSIPFSQVSHEIGLLYPSIDVLYKVQPGFYVESGLDVLSKARTINRFGFYGGLYHTIERTYISLPLGVRLATPGRLSLYVNPSFHTAYWTSGLESAAYARFSGITEDEPIVEVKDQKYRFDSSYEIDQRKDNRFEFSASIGTGLQYDLRRWGLINAGVDFYRGLTDLYKYEQKPEDHRSRYNSGVIIYLGYNFPFKTF